MDNIARHEDRSWNIKSTDFRDGFSENIGGLYHETKWKDFLQTAEACGFEFGYHKLFWVPENEFTGKKVAEDEAILYNKGNGMILYASSFEGDTLNEAVLYGEIKIASDNMLGKREQFLRLCSNVRAMGSEVSFTMDVRRGFEFYYRVFISLFKFNKKWKLAQNLNFVNYGDRMDTKGFSFKEITKRKIRESSEEVKAIVCI